MFRIDTKAARAKLGYREGPYFIKIMRGRFLGFRKLRDGSGTWVARALGENGVRRTTSLGDDTEQFSFDQAVEVARALFKNFDAGITGETGDGEPATVEAACREYVADRRRQKGEATANNADKFFERRIYGVAAKAPATGWKHEPDPIAQVRLDKFRAKHLLDWRDRLVEDGLGRESINREMTTLRAALNLAVANRLVGADKAREWRSVKPFKNAGSGRTIYLDREQRKAFLKAATGSVRNLIEAVMHTGARPGELVGARRSAFDARTGSLTLAGKTGARSFPLSPAAVTLFKRLAENKLPGAFLLTRDDGKPWGHSDWDELIRDTATKAGMPAGTVLYTLRHSWITEAITSGMSPLEVARMVGTSLKMIDKTYGHLALTTTRERLASIEMV
jgi:integrase